MKLTSIIGILNISLILCVCGCSGTQEMIYKQKKSVVFQSSDCVKSLDPIDKFETREVQFSILQKEKCILISCVGYSQRESIAGGEDQLPLYFILDRKIRTINNRPSFSEIARNFTNDWQPTSTVKTCSQESLPLQSLSPGEYRIRITSFKDKPFRFELTIQSSAQIEFITK
jgi:hypothetical protein